MAFSPETYGAVKKWTQEYVPAEIDKAIVGSSTPKGKWSALTNTPTLADGTGIDGDYYDCIEAGTFNGEDYVIGDIVKYASGHWYKVATHIDVDSTKQYAQEAANSATVSESYANMSQDKANQSANSATQSGTYATQSGNYAVEAMTYRDDVFGKFFQGTKDEYNEAIRQGKIRTDTIAFIMQETA